jgi:hypothetical protein
VASEHDASPWRISRQRAVFDDSNGERGARRRKIKAVYFQ